jgi:hypothetical protein
LVPQKTFLTTVLWVEIDWWLNSPSVCSFIKNSNIDYPRSANQRRTYIIFHNMTIISTRGRGKRILGALYAMVIFFTTWPSQHGVAVKGFWEHSMLLTKRTQW